MPTTQPVVPYAADSRRKNCKNRSSVSGQKRQNMFGDQSRTDRVDFERAFHGVWLKRTPGFLGFQIHIMQHARCDNHKVDFVKALGRFGNSLFVLQINPMDRNDLFSGRHSLRS